MTSDILIRSRCHEDAPTDIVHTYTFNGATHHLTRAELDAVEITGRCSVLSYLTTPSIPHRHVLLTSITMMHERPWPIAQGTMPAEAVPHNGKKGRTNKPGIGGSQHPEILHLMRRNAKPGTLEAACGVRGLSGMVFGFVRFGRMRTSAKACVMCLGAWNAELMSGDYRRKSVPNLVRKEKV